MLVMVGTIQIHCPTNQSLVEYSTYNFLVKYVTRHFTK